MTSPDFIDRNSIRNCGVCDMMPRIIIEDFYEKLKIETKRKCYFFKAPLKRLPKENKIFLRFKIK